MRKKAVMTSHVTLPSEIEPECLADLIADCRSVIALLPPLPSGLAGRPGLAGLPAVVIPDDIAALLNGMPEYGD
jgi:hypothetical protein